LPTLGRERQYSWSSASKIWRKDNVAVFARSIPGRAPHEFEVVIIRIAPAAVSPSGSAIPVREEYPSSNKWGKYGWSIPKRDQAIAWAEMILTNLAKPQRERTAWPELFSQFKSGLADGKTAAGTVIKKTSHLRRPEYPSRRNQHH
jgi:hypothetical protein